MSGVFINKLIVDREKRFNNNNKIIKILRYTGKQLAKKDIRKLIEVIFRNFEELEHNKDLKHNREEITRVLTSNSSLIILALLNGKIVGYLVAEITIYNMKRLMHIYYIYTAPIFRGNGIATQMLNLIQVYSSEDYNINTLSLTFDTYNKGLTKFYLDNNFNFDIELRSYQRYDMFVKYI